MRGAIAFGAGLIVGAAAVGALLVAPDDRGPTLSTFESGRPRSFGDLDRSGRPVGTWVTWYRSGRVRSVQEGHRGGVPFGTYREWAEDGTLRCAGRKEGSERVGTWTISTSGGGVETVHYGGG